jgi:hypothetical protein
MLALPVSFLPFDPNRDNKESDDEDDEEELTPESDEESNEDSVLDPIVNGDTNHESKHTPHIGGGVLLVREFFYLSDVCDTPKQTPLRVLFLHRKRIYKLSLVLMLVVVGANQMTIGNLSKMI